MANIFNTFKQKAAANEAQTPTIDQSTVPIYDLVEFVATNKARKLLWAGGYTLTADEDDENYDTLLDILKENKFEKIMASAEYNLSKRWQGNQLTYTQPDIDGNIRFGLFDMANEPFFFTDQYGKVIFARTYILGTYGNFQFRIYQIWTLNKMTSIIEYKDATGNFIQLDFTNQDDVDRFKSLPISFKFLQEWEYEEMPLNLLLNLDDVGATSYGDGYLARQEQDVLNATYEASLYELEENYTKVFSGRADAEIKTTGFKGFGFGDRRRVVKVGNGGDGSLDTVIQGNPQLNSFDTSNKEIRDRYVEASGYSSEADFTGTQTQVGVLFQGKADIETTNYKKAVREDQIISIIDTIINVYNQFNAPMVFENNPVLTINAFTALDKDKRREEFKEMDELGILDKEEAISHYYGTDDEDKIQSIKSKTEDEDRLKEQEADDTDEQNADDEDLGEE